MTSWSDPTVAHFGAQAERKGSSIPRGEHRTCGRHGGLSDPRRRFDIVVVARQTHIHTANLDGRRSPSVPGASPAPSTKQSQHHNPGIHRRKWAIRTTGPLCPWRNHIAGRSGRSVLGFAVA